mmetsp:Transcript_43218/g.128041  ORF Transcript_43218/g.128041 Transcript_43218/m.128041 type:complete len:237 (-) Transcript_43218:23-733(-)
MGLRGLGLHAALQRGVGVLVRLHRRSAVLVGLLLRGIGLVLLGADLGALDVALRGVGQLLVELRDAVLQLLGLRGELVEVRVGLLDAVLQRREALLRLGQLLLAEARAVHGIRVVVHRVRQHVAQHALHVVQGVGVARGDLLRGGESQGGQLRGVQGVRALAEHAHRPGETTRVAIATQGGVVHSASVPGQRQAARRDDAEGAEQGAGQQPCRHRPWPPGADSCARRHSEVSTLGP